MQLLFALAFFKVVADSEILILITILIIFYLFFVLFFLLPGQEIGLKHFTPPYLDPTTTGPVVLQGVSYASGGGGILNHTGKIFVSFLDFYLI